MARFKGDQLILQVDVAAVPTTLAHFEDVNLNMGRPVIVGTTNTDGGKRKVYPGTFEATIDFTASDDDADTSHIELWNSIDAGTPIDVTIKVGGDTYAGIGYVSSLAHAGGVDSVAKVSGTIDIDGGLTKT